MSAGWALRPTQEVLLAMGGMSMTKRLENTGSLRVSTQEVLGSHADVQPLA